MIICPKCNGCAEFSSYFKKYQCLSKGCNWYLDPRDMTDEDKLYFNGQERYERWELNEPVENFWTENGCDFYIKWKDGTFSIIKQNDLMKLIFKLLKEEIQTIK